MSVGTAAAIGIAAGIGGATSIASGVIGSRAAGKAAKTQSAAAMSAAQLEKQAADNSLAFQKQQYADSQRNLSPWLQSGQTSLANLNYLLGLGPDPSSMPSTTAGAAPGSMGIGSGSTTPAPGVLRPGPGVQQGIGDVPGKGPKGFDSPLINTFGGASSPGAPVQNGPASRYLQGGSSPEISPDQQTTASWKAQGIPFQNITVNGQTVAVRTDPSSAPGQIPTGIQPSSASLVNPSIGGFGSLAKGFDEKFQAPTNVTEQNDPGYQFRLQEGAKALERGAAARGDLLSGGTAKALTQYGQDYASNEYGNLYNRQQQEYAQRYNIFNQNQTNQFNRYASLAGMGQTTAQQLNSSGQNFANASSSILGNSAAQQGQALNNSGAATASGYVNGANAWTGALGGLSASSQLPLYMQLLQRQQQNSPGGLYGP